MSGANIQAPGASVGGLTASVIDAAVAGTALSTNTLIIIGVIIIALIIAVIIYIRRGGSDAKEARASAIREKLALMKELENLEK